MSRNTMKLYDVIVVDGGLAGVAAAISAAREGADVMLLERYGLLGGMAVSGLVNPFMPYWQFDDERNILYGKPVNQGVFSEVIQQLYAMGALSDNKKTFHEEYLKLFLIGCVVHIK